MGKIKKTTEEKAEHIMRMVKTGEYLNELRTKKERSLKEVADNLSLSPTYLSEIERGIKEPSAYLIRELSEFYGIDESEIFDLLGRIPLTVVEDFDDFEPLKSLFNKISTNKHMKDEKRYDVYERLHRAYIRMMEEED